MPLPPPPIHKAKPSPVASKQQGSLVPMRSTYIPEWVAMLKECKYPEDVVVIDFETYFDDKYSMHKMSTIEFVEDPRFEVLGVATLYMPGWAPFTDRWAAFHVNVDRELDFLKAQYGENLEGCTVVMQNAAFDGLILARKYGIYPPHIVDTLGLARHIDARKKNDLKSLCKRYGLPDKGETMAFKGVSHRHRLKPAKKGPPIRLPKITEDQLIALAEYANNDANQEWALFIRMFPKLSNTLTELRLMQHTLELFYKPTLAVDFAFGEDLMAKMDAEIDAVAEKIGYTRKELSGTNSFVKLLGGALIETGETIPTKPGKKGPIPALSKADPEREMLLKHSNEKVRQLMKGKAAVQSWPLHIKRIKRIMDQARAASGLLCVPLKYHGAHTGRWSGGEKINLQNLSSRNKSELINSIRSLLIAPDGMELVVVDASQIEARVLAWIAGQEDLCEKFRNGAEVYCELAAKIVGKPIRKATKSDPKPLAAYLKRMRDMGKVGILGGGYGLGWEKCIAFASQTYGVELIESESRKLIKEYRESVPAITKFWKDIEKAFSYSCKYGKPCELPRGLKFHKEDTTTIISLPNGRTLKYEGARVSYNAERMRDELWMPDPMKPGKRIHMWGGYLTENVVQAMSRDILAESILNLENDGYHVALHVHDEDVAVVPVGMGVTCLDAAIKHLSTAPAWAPGCPLGAEGHVATRYGK